MKAEITLLGKFSMTIDGKDITESLGSSKKKVDLICYLILNHNKTVSSYDMFDALWPNNDNGNPESSLKTLVSRTRSMFESFGLYDTILTRGGFYLWNDENADIYVDVFELERLHKLLTTVKVLTPEADADFQRTTAIYNGDLLPTASSSDSWSVPKSMYYHNLYIEIINHYISLLSAAKRDNDIIYVSRKALDIDPFDSELNLRLLEALTAAGRHQEALAQYNCTNNIHYTYLGVRPSDEILTFYKNLIRIENDSSRSIEAVRSELESDDTGSGAFMCEYAIFKDIYQLNMRNLKRFGASMFLSLVVLSPIDKNDNDFLLLDKMVTDLGEVIKFSLRRGDTVSRYSPNQYTLLLPMVDYSTGSMVMERVKAAFYKRHPGTRYIVNYYLRPLGAPAESPHGER